MPNFAQQNQQPLGRKKRILQQLAIEKVVAGGRGLARHRGKIVFVESTLPGDVVDAVIRKKKPDYTLASPYFFHEKSPLRGVAFCEHSGQCGGCKWQHVAYREQLRIKEEIVREAFERTGKITDLPLKPVIGAPADRHYRNKMEYTFSERGWLSREEILSGKEISTRQALGLHVPGAYDKVMNISTCWLQDDFGNRIRNEIRAFTIEQQMSFYNLRERKGWLRQLVLRNSTLGEWLVIIVMANDEPKMRENLLSFIRDRFPEITSLQYVINPKPNTTIYDLPVELFYGKDHITEQIGKYRFRVGPKSFFQVNPAQARVLYDLALDYAGLKGNETVYDLYSGTGTIAIYISEHCDKLYAIESVPEAVADARENARLNGIDKIHFHCGDMKDLLKELMDSGASAADVIIADPPRAGMHPKVVEQILASGARKVVYISCNPVTQARDILRLQKKYRLEILQPVDMFPHTYHIETVTLLARV